MKDNYDNAIKLMAIDIPEGGTKNGQRCPKCGGGVHGDRAFSITRKRDGTLYFICFRASCGFRGRILSLNGLPGYDSGTGRLRLLVTKRATESSRTFSQEEKLLFRKHYAGTSDSFLQRLRKYEVDSYIGIPFYDNYRRMVGYNKRNDKRLGWDGKGRKSIIEFLDEKPATIGDWYYCTGTTDIVIIVEDQISADCINNICGIDTFAIMGSHISDEVIKKLKSIGYKRLLLAMDADAWRKADKFEQRYRILGVRAIKWNSRLDPKNMPIKELREVFCESI